MENQTGFDPKRRLCPDGACTGIIGADGRCGECGRAAGTNDAPADLLPEVGVQPEMALDPAFGEGAPDLEGAPPREAAPDLDASGSSRGAAFDPGRRLCDDGACVGIVGPTGLCTICGRRAGG